MSLTGVEDRRETEGVDGGKIEVVKRARGGKMVAGESEVTKAWRAAPESPSFVYDRREFAIIVFGASCTRVFKNQTPTLRNFYNY